MDFFGTQYTNLKYKNASEGLLDKTAFVKFKTSNNFKQNSYETHSGQQKSIGKSIPAYGI
jgi:hypothetical protein